MTVEELAEEIMRVDPSEDITKLRVVVEMDEGGDLEYRSVTKVRWDYSRGRVVLETGA